MQDKCPNYNCNQQQSYLYNIGRIKGYKLKTNRNSLEIQSKRADSMTKSEQNYSLQLDTLFI